MSRKKVAILLASTLVILYSYQIIVDIGDGAEMNWLMLLLLGLAVALLVVEIRAVEKHKKSL